jgi:hypothetical protein
VRSEYLSIAFIALGIGLFIPEKALADDTRSSAVVTRTLVTRSGWEQSLINRDPSLAHWHWNAMSAYTSARVPMTAPTATQSSARPAAPPQSIPMSRYSKPNHAPLPYVSHDFVRPPTPHASGQQNLTTQSKTSLSYSAKRPDAAAATYRQGYQNSAGTAPHALAYSSQANVHGKLIAKHM